MINSILITSYIRSYAWDVKELRIEAGMSQTELASVLKISQQVIYKYENGLAEPDIAKLVEIAYFFGVSVDYLIGNSDAKIVSDTNWIE